MTDPKLPVYAICGADAAVQSAFLGDFCIYQRPLTIRIFQGEQPQGTAPGLLWLNAAQTPQAAGAQLAAWVRHTPADSLWFFWQDDVPIDWLLCMMAQTEMLKACKLAKIIRVGETASEQALFTHLPPAVQDQLAQCNLYALTAAPRAQVAKLRSVARALQPDIEVVTTARPEDVTAALYGKNLLQPLRFGLIVAVCVLVIVLLPRFSFSFSKAVSIFLGTFLQALPFLMLGIFLSSAIQVFVPADFLQRVFPKKLLSGMLFGVLGGFLMPVCDCASVPVFRSLVKKGVPVPAAVTFMLSAPVINPVVMLSTYYAFGGNVRIMFARMGFGVVCSLIIGLMFAGGRQNVLLNQATVVPCGCGHAHGDESAHACGPEHGPVYRHEHAHVNGRIPAAEKEHTGHGDCTPEAETAVAHEPMHEQVLAHEHKPVQEPEHTYEPEQEPEHTHEPEQESEYTHKHTHEPIQSCTADAGQAGCRCMAHTLAWEETSDAGAIPSTHTRHAGKGRYTRPGWVGAAVHGLVALIHHFTEEFFEVAKFLLIGIAVSTLLQLAMGKQMTGMSIDNLAEGMLLMMAMAFLLSLCSSSDAVVGKNMGAALPLGAVMGFLVFGPMMDIKNLILMASSFSRRFMVKLLLATFTVCFAAVYIAFSLGLGGLLA